MGRATRLALQGWVRPEHKNNKSFRNRNILCSFSHPATATPSSRRFTDAFCPHTPGIPQKMCEGSKAEPGIASAPPATDTGRVPAHRKKKGPKALYGNPGWFPSQRRAACPCAAFLFSMAVHGWAEASQMEADLSHRPGSINTGQSDVPPPQIGNSRVFRNSGPARGRAETVSTIAIMYNFFLWEVLILNPVVIIINISIFVK